MLTDEDVDDIERDVRDGVLTGPQKLLDIRSLVEALRVERATSKQLRDDAARLKNALEALVDAIGMTVVAGPIRLASFDGLEEPFLNARQALLGDVSAKGAAQ